MSYNYSRDMMEKVLQPAQTVAVVGLSPKQDRPSNMVARYLIQAGYKVIPVNPGQGTILDRICYPDLSSIPEDIDIVNIFRKPEQVPPIVAEAIAKGCKTVWMQLGIVNEEGAKLAQSAGITVIMDRCIKIEHQKISPTGK